MATSAHTLRPHFGIRPRTTPESSAPPPEDDTSSCDQPPPGTTSSRWTAATALRWLIVPALGLAVYATLRRRTREPKAQYMSDEWLHTTGHWRHYGA